MEFHYFQVTQLHNSEFPAVKIQTLWVDRQQATESK